MRDERSQADHDRFLAEETVIDAASGRPTVDPADADINVDPDAGLLAKLTALFPPGTMQVAAALLVTGLTAYAFLAVANRALSAKQYDSVSVLWALVFLLGPGLFIPVEQEVGRAIAHRRSLGQGWTPVVRRAAQVAVVFAVVLTIAIFAANAPLRKHLFDNQWLVLIGLVLGVDGYAMEHLLRGTLAGQGRFAAYGWVFGVESVLRLVGAVGLAIVGVKTAGPFGLVVGVCPLIAVLLVGRHQREGLLEPGPEAHLPEISQNLGLLLAASIGNFGLINCTPVAARLLTHGDANNAGTMLNGLLIARVPLFFFQAVQAALLPNLAKMAAERRFAEFRADLRKLAVVVAFIAVAGVVGCLVLGPFVVDTMFPSKHVLSRIDLAILALGSVAIMVGIVTSQASISLGGHRDAAIGWLAGLLAFVAACALPGAVLTRVTLAFLIGTSVGAVLLTAMLARRLQAADPNPDPGRPSPTAG
jgi:O-antigen/teichoic acid export membrane protein